MARGDSPGDNSDGMNTDELHEQAPAGVRESVPPAGMMENITNGRLPHWRIHFKVEELDDDDIPLELYGAVILGHGQSDVAFVDLSTYEAQARGVSRRHIELRPTPHGLFAVDLNSTNGTYVNGILLQPGSPTLLNDGDILSLSLLQLTVGIDEKPHHSAEWFERQATLAQVLTEMAKAVTTQIKVETVLNTVVDYALGLTGAQQATLWLLQPDSRELSLEAARNTVEGLEPGVRRSVAETLLGEVILTGQPRFEPEPGAQTLVEIAEDYIARTAVLLPIAQGGLTFGVLVVTNDEFGHTFADQIESLLSALADFAAIAIHNSRTIEATDEALHFTLAAQQEATAQALERARIQSDFLGTVSHELRSPLHTMLGYAGMARDGDLGEMDDGVLEALEQVINNGNRLNAILDDLLASINHAAKELPFETDEFDPRDLVSEVIASQMPTANRKGLTMRWSGNPEVPSSLVGDPKRIYQVVLNLVNNALKYTDKGHVSVRLDMVGTQMWAVHVTDTGRGVAPKYHEVVFERFVRLNADDDDDGDSSEEGVGLGLAISRDLVRQMGGALRLESEGVDGAGSTFSMVLPIEQPTPTTGDLHIDRKSGTHKIFKAKYGTGMNE